MAEDEGRDIPDKYLIEIGRVTTRWAVLESILDLSLMKLCGKDITDPRSLIIFNHMAFPMKLDILGALVSELIANHPGLSEFSSVLNLLKQAQEKRNFISHSKWGLDEQNRVEISRVTARGKLKTMIMPISAEEIKTSADLIREASHRLFYLVKNAETTNKPPQTGQ